MNKWDYLEAWERWWKGKLCKTRTAWEFKRVVKVVYAGPPSGVYCDAQLVFEDGSTAFVYHGDAFRPRKSDVEVKEE